MSLIERRSYRKMWERIGKSDQERISHLKLPQGVSFRSFRYIEDGDDMHTLSVYWPDGAQGDLPVIIDIHGGGWMYGSKEVNRPVDMALSSLGFIVVGMSYRQAPQVDLKGMMADIAAACRWAYDHRVEFRADFGRAFLTGDSAGGHLVAVTAALEHSERVRNALGLDPLPFHIRAINMNHAVPYVAESHMSSKGKIVNYFGRKELLSELYGRGLKRDRKLFRLTSDFDNLVDSCTSFPPTHILTSTGDRSFHDQSLRVYRKLQERRIESELVDVEGERHVFNVIHMDEPVGIRANKGIADFFLAHAGDIADGR